MQSILSPFQQTVRRYALAEGGNQTGIPLVTAWRFTRETIQMPQTDHPYLYLVLDGVLRLHTPSGILDYVAGQCSISKIDTPLAGTVLLFSSQHDFLALSVEFSTAEVITAVLNLDDSLTEKILAEQVEEQAMAAADRAALQAVYQLFPAMHQTIPSEFLRKNIMQQVIYFFLCGSSGRQFLQSIVQIGQADTIYQANRWIKENFRSPFTVEELAEKQNMNVSLFHQKFKSAVGMGPLLRQKVLP